MDFSPCAYKCLQRAGWHSGRTFDTRQFEEILCSRNCPAHPVAMDFLKCFGGIHVFDQEDEFHFDVAKAARRNNPKAISKYSSMVGVPLCVIGEAFCGRMVLMMDSDGKVYAARDHLVLEIGRSGPDAIDALCSGKEFERVH